MRCISSRPDHDHGKTVILSGIQPTGVPHLGNYLGALRNWVKLQDQYIGIGENELLDAAEDKEHGGGKSMNKTGNKVLYSIVDLHAITLPQDPKLLSKNILDMATALLACGVDPKKSILFRQSRVPQHTELAWILFCRTPIGWLSRMHQWKSKIQDLKSPSTTTDTTSDPSNTNRTNTLADMTLSLLNESSIMSGEVAPTSDDFGSIVLDGVGTAGPGLGLLAYPVLQAADILLYKATKVPVGEDQLQHMNLTAMIAKSFNSQYGKEVFPIPKGVFASSTTKKIMSLRQPTTKMSKSNPSSSTRIELTDDASSIRSKIRRAVVDSTRGITYDPITRPGVANLLRMQAAFSCVGEEDEQVVVERLAREQSGMGHKEFKDRVADVVVEGLSGVRGEIERLKKEKGYVEEVLLEGEEGARRVAEETMRGVRRSVGL